jgi:uncharacterized membrane protein YjgN (DUF898 family)
MTEFVHLNEENLEKGIKAIFVPRKIRTKMMLFSSKMLLFVLTVLLVAGLLIFDSYLKAYKSTQQFEIGRQVDKKRELSFKKNEIDNSYLKMISSVELMKKAGELDLKVATNDKVIDLR